MLREEIGVLGSVFLKEPRRAFNVREEKGALALPAAKQGTVWRVARAYDGHVATEVEERTLNSSTVIVLRALAPGRTSISYALTAGETSSRALRAIRLDLQVH